MGTLSKVVFMSVYNEPSVSGRKRNETIKYIIVYHGPRFSTLIAITDTIDEAVRFCKLHRLVDIQIIPVQYISAVQADKAKSDYVT